MAMDSLWISYLTWGEDVRRRQVVVKLQRFFSVETPCRQTSEVPLSRDTLESNFRGSSQSRHLGIKLQRFFSVETPCRQTSEVPLSRDTLKSNFRGSSQSRHLGIKLQRFFSVETPCRQTSEVPLSRELALVARNLMLIPA